MSIASRVAVLSSVAVLLSACSTESIHVKVLRPAPVNLGQFGVIAVDSFTGDGGDELANELTAALANTRNPLTGRVDFNVLDRREVDQMLEELRNHRGTDWDEKTMEILERWRSAEILLKGDVRNYTVLEGISEVEWVDPAGYVHVTYTRECTAKLMVVIEATDTEGNILFDTVQFHEVAADSTSAVDEQPSYIDHESLLAAARQSAVHRYLLRVIPREEYVQVHLFTDGDIPALQMGNGFAKTGAWDGALDSYRTALQQIRDTAPEVRYKALFNLGVALEYTNEFDEARAALQEAYAIEQDSMILQELQNVSYREQEYKQLLEQGQSAAARPSR